MVTGFFFFLSFFVFPFLLSDLINFSLTVLDMDVLRSDLSDHTLSNLCVFTYPSRELVPFPDAWHLVWFRDLFSLTQATCASSGLECGVVTSGYTQLKALTPLLPESVSSI